MNVGLATTKCTYRRPASRQRDQISNTDYGQSINTSTQASTPTIYDSHHTSTKK